MYRALLLGIVASFIILAAEAQDPSSVEQEFLSLENAWTGAFQKHDGAFLEKLLADDFIDTDYDGTVTNKAQDIAAAKSNDVQIESFHYDNVRVRVYGDTAVVTSRNTQKSTHNGRDTSGVRVYTDVFVKRDGRWQAVASHTSMVTAKK